MKSERIWGIWVLSYEYCKLGEVIQITSGKVCPSQNKSGEGPFPIMGANGIIGYSTECLYDSPVILVGRVGSCGEVHRVNNPCWPSDNTLVVIPKENEDFDYIEYCLRYGDIYPWISGSTQPLLTQTALKQMEIPWPKKEIRRAIGFQGQALERVIYSNRKTVDCIVEITSSLFRSWFIDFDPVKAKAEGKLPYGMDQETAALFPDSFEDSELGPIPAGWNVGRIGDIADISSGTHQPERSEQKSSEYCTPLVGGAGIIAWTIESLFDEPIIVIGRVGTLGIVEKYTSPVWPSDNTLIFKTHQNSSFHFLLYQLRLQDFGAYNRGSTQPLLAQSDMRKLKLIIPNEDVLMAFEKKIRLMALLSDLIEEQSEILTKTRDTLLPRLISGELEVPIEA